MVVAVAVVPVGTLAIVVPLGPPAVVMPVPAATVVLTVTVMALGSVTFAAFIMFVPVVGHPDPVVPAFKMAADVAFGAATIGVLSDDPAARHPGLHGDDLPAAGRPAVVAAVVDDSRIAVAVAVVLAVVDD